MGRTIGLTVGILVIGLVLNTGVVHAHGSAATKPSVPVLSSPADGALTSDNTPTFSWEASTDSDGHTLTYTIEVSASADFSTGVTSTGDLTTTSHTPSSAIADGTWYWRARAVDSHNVKSQFSSGRSLAVDTTAPSAPAVTAVTSPVNADSQTVTGSAEANALVRITGGAAEASQQLSGGATAFSIPVSLTQDASNALSVTARDAAGNTSSASSVSVVEDSTAPAAPTASPNGGLFNTSQSVTLSAESGATIRYTTDGSTPTTSSPQYSSALTISGTTTLRAIAIDAAGNVSSVLTESYTIDTTAPDAPTASPTGGLFNAAQSVALTAESGATIRYTTDGTTPTSASPAYTSALSVSSTTTVKAIATDAAGNTSAVMTHTYTIDTTPPAAPTATPTGGLFNASQSVTLSGESGATIRYTTDGSTPTSASAQYTAALSIGSTTTLKAIAIDAADNTSSVLTETYTIDTTPPAAPAVTTVASPVNADSQTVTGTAEANALVTITGGAATASQQLSGGATAFSISVSLTQDATNTLSVTATDTAGNVSSAAGATIVEDSTGPEVVFSPSAGLYQGIVRVTLSAEAGAATYYTLDGTTPTTASARYQGSIDLGDTRVVSAIAVDAAGNIGASRGAEYGVARTGGPPGPPAGSADESTTSAPRVKSVIQQRGASRKVVTARNTKFSHRPAVAPQVAGMSSVRTRSLLLPFLNRLFREAHGRIPTITEWNSWAHRILAGHKSSLPAVLGAMQWHAQVRLR